MDTNNLTEIDERINRFLKGGMTPEETESFKNELERDPELKARAVSQAFLVRSLQKSGKQHDEKVIEAAKSLHKSAVFHPIKTIYKRIIYSTAALIALLIVCVLLARYYQESQSEDPPIVQTYKKGNDDNATLVGNDDFAELADSYLHHSGILFVPYTSGDAVSQAQLIDLINIFISIIEKNELEENTQCLALIKSEIDKDECSAYAAYHYDVAWYLALAYLELGNKDEAVRILEEYIEKNTETTAMQELLEEIEKVGM